MSPSESTPNTTEQASWINDPVPSFFTSIRNRIKARAGALYDGAYLGFTDEPVYIAEYHPEINALSFLTHTPKKRKIAAINPGAEKISGWLPIIMEGNSLAIPNGTGHEKLTHVEAESGKLIEEVDYPRILRYLGFNQNAVHGMNMLGQMSVALDKITGVKLPQSAYQVTKEGQKSGLLLVNEKHRPSFRPPFWGGPGSFRQRKHATSH